MKNYFFQDSGLRFDLTHLRDIFPKAHLLEVEVMAEYVDAVVSQMCQAGDAIDVPPFDGASAPLNMTSIGNTAYIALYHPDVATREAALAYIHQFKAHRS